MAFLEALNGMKFGWLCSAEECGRRVAGCDSSAQSSKSAVVSLVSKRSPSRDADTYRLMWGITLCSVARMHEHEHDNGVEDYNLLKY